MKVLTLILILAITMALSVTVTMNKTTDKEDKLSDANHAIEARTTSSSDESFTLHENAKMPARRVSRFLLDQQVTATAAMAKANICLVNQAFCVSVDIRGHWKNSTCCYPRCVHLQSDRRNCGSCGKLCKYGKICCGGHCVNPESDARHCGKCHTRCARHEKCVNAYCGYAS